VHSITPHMGQARRSNGGWVVLGELCAQDMPIELILEMFMSRRYQRCRLIYEASLQLGRWSNLQHRARTGPAHVRHGQSARTADLTF